MTKKTEFSESILVTGSTGFIGSRLLPTLLEKGHEVTALTRQSPPDSPIDGVRYIHTLGDGEDWPYTTVINLAGENLFAKRWNDTQKSIIRDSRINFTRDLVDKIQRAPNVTRLVSGSAIGYYGPRDSAPLKEVHSPGADFAAKLCEDWEHEAFRAQTNQRSVAVLRIGIVLGRNGGALASLLPVFKLGLGGRTGSGEQWMSWIHIDDLVRAIAMLVERRDLQGPINATAPVPVQNGQFARTLAGVLNRPALLPMPAFALKALLGEVSALLLTGQRVVPARLEGAGFRFTFPQLERALSDICRGS